MQTPSKDRIKDQEGDYFLLRKESYNSRTTPLIEWQVAQRLQPNLWRLEREFKTKRDAQEWLYICAKV